VTEPKVVITGTGRAGTTLLVELLTELGLDTGLHEGKLSFFGHRVRAGLECRIDEPGAPTVVKDITLGFRIREVLEAGEVPIRHAIIPTRRLDVATASRIRAADYGRRPFRRGGLTGTLRAAEQEEVLRRIQSDLFAALEDFGVPYTVLEFPRFATDAHYTHHALAPLVPGASVDDVAQALERVVQLDLIHEAPLSRGERWRMRITSLWMNVVRLPVGRLVQRLDPRGSEARLKARVAESRRRDAEARQRELALRAERPGESPR
jgi:hypothetical protein